MSLCPLILPKLLMSFQRSLVVIPHFWGSYDERYEKRAKST